VYHERDAKSKYYSTTHAVKVQDAQLFTETMLQGASFLAKSGRPELGVIILRTL